MSDSEDFDSESSDEVIALQDKGDEESVLLRYRHYAEKIWEKRKGTLFEVQQNFEKYKDRFNIVALHHIILPQDYFLEFVQRNPITGTIKQSGVESQLDFAFVDLYERPYVCDTPENIERDQYMFKFEVLATRTWLYQQLVYQLECEREGESPITHVYYRKRDDIHDIRRGQCAKDALGLAVCDKKRIGSSFQTMVVATILTPFSKSILLIVCTCFLSVLSLWSSSTMNVPVLFRFTRAVDLPFRLVFLILVGGELSDMTGALQEGFVGIVRVLALISVLLVLLGDMLKGDLSMILNLNSEMRIEIIKELAEKLWVCRFVKAKTFKKDITGGVQDTAGGGEAQRQRKNQVKFTKKSGINRAIMGQVPENIDEADCILVADIEGVLVKLMPIDKESITHYEAYRRRMERRPPHSIDVSNYKRAYMKRSSFLQNISAQPAKKEEHHQSRKKKIVEEVQEDNRSPMERLQDRSIPK